VVVFSVVFAVLVLAQFVLWVVDILRKLKLQHYVPHPCVLVFESVLRVLQLVAILTCSALRLVEVDVVLGVIRVVLHLAGLAMQAHMGEKPHV